MSNGDVPVKKQQRSDSEYNIITTCVNDFESSDIDIKDKYCDYYSTHYRTTTILSSMTRLPVMDFHHSITKKLALCHMVLDQTD